MQNFIDRIADGQLPAQVVVVVASRADAGGIERARRAGIPAVVVARKQFPDVDRFNALPASTRDSRKGVRR